MKDCTVQTQVKSTLPELARNAHGNVQQQNRIFGAVRGVDTTRPPITTPIGFLIKQELETQHRLSQTDKDSAAKTDGLSLAKKNNCLFCHGVDHKIVGPGFAEVSARYKSDSGAEARLIEKVRQGGTGNWGGAPMPAQTQVSNDDIKLLVNWILKEVK